MSRSWCTSRSWLLASVLWKNHNNLALCSIKTFNAAYRYRRWHITALSVLGFCSWNVGLVWPLANVLESVETGTLKVQSKWTHLKHSWHVEENIPSYKHMNITKLQISVLLNRYLTRGMSHIFQSMKFSLVAPVEEQNSRSQGDTHREEHQESK